MLNRIHYFLYISLFLFILTTCTQAEELMLKNGEKITCKKIFSISPEGVTLQVVNGIDFYDWSSFTESTARSISSEHYDTYLKTQELKKTHVFYKNAWITKEDYAAFLEKRQQAKMKKLKKQQDKKKAQALKAKEKKKTAKTKITPKHAKELKKRLRKEVPAQAKSAYVDMRFRETVNYQDRSNLLDTLNKFSFKIGTDLGLNITNPILVYIEPDHLGITKEHASACYLPSIQALMIPERLLQKPLSSYQDILVHELTHYLLDRTGPTRLPGWMEEGTAEYYESDETFPKDKWKYLAYLQKNNKLLSLSKLKRFHSLGTDEDFSNAYIHAHAAIYVLVKEIGKRRYLAMIRSLKNGHDFDMTFKAVTRYSVNAYDIHLKNIIRNKGKGIKKHR